MKARQYGDDVISHRYAREKLIQIAIASLILMLLSIIIYGM